MVAEFIPGCHNAIFLVGAIKNVLLMTEAFAKGFNPS
jgi:hypothetical protein